MINVSKLKKLRANRHELTGKKHQPSGQRGNNRRCFAFQNVDNYQFILKA